MKKLLLFVSVLLFTGQILMAQKTVSGAIYGIDKMPLVGATVLVQGTNNSVITNYDGLYTISVKSENDILLFSYLGFVTTKVAVGSQTKINVVLKEEQNQLNEVVVVGYGTQKKSDVTGAVSSVNAKTLEARPTLNIEQALQGSMAGVNVSVGSNTASGASNKITIRGRKSINASSDPLIVLDGIVFNGSLSDINVNDMQNVEVLKDASSAAIYGSRGANGVILLTTKKGTKDGIAKLSASTYFGVDKIYELPDMMDADTYYKRKIERFGATSSLITPTERDVYAKGEAVDWLDLALRDGTRTEHNVSVSGGSKTAKYFLSGNFQDVKGVAVNDDFSRVSLRTNVEVDLKDWLKLGTNTFVSFSNRDGIGSTFASSDGFGGAFFMSPLGRAYNPDGSLTMTPVPEDTGFRNPLEPTLYDNSDKSNSLTTNNYILINFPFAKGLSYKLNTGYTVGNTRAQTYRGLDTRTGFEVGGSADDRRIESRDWLVENILNYERTFGNHNLFITALYSAQEKNANILSINGIGFPNDVRSFYQLADAKTLKTIIDPDFPPYKQENYVSEMLRVNYNYKSKYLLTATARRDGYSAFGFDTKFGLFPSMALGWNINKESFLENSKVVDLLKLRASYGVNGNQAVAAYSTLPVLSKQDYIDAAGQNLVGYRPGSLGNDDLGWETTTSLNLGVDFGLFNSRINGSVEVYSSNTTDLLLKKSIPGINGPSTILQNIGETKGRGLEVTLNTKNIVAKNFSWDSQLTFSKNENEIVNVGLKDVNGNYIDDVASKWFIGQPIDVNYGYKMDGIWQTDQVAAAVAAGIKLSDLGAKQAGDVKYTDINGDGKITTADRTIIGTLQPDFTIGFNNTFVYKNISLSFFLYCVEGVTKNNLLITTNDQKLRQRAYNENYWSPTNPTNDFPENADRVTNSLSAQWYEDASFIRLKDVTFTYKLPQDALKKMSLDKLEFFVNAKNLFTLTDWKGIDPESDSQTDRPFSRTYNFGVRLGL
jgi:TonB-linked SusC/RagA family outer membrane protein